MSKDDVSGTTARVLLVYYTHTKQAQRVSDAMAEVLRERGCDVSQAAIGFTDPHYAKNFSSFPFRHAVFSILPLLWPQARRKTGRIQIPDDATRDDYDLVCIGSATWWLTTGRPPTVGQSEGEVELDYVFTNTERALFGIGALAGTRGGGGADIFFEWSTKD